MIKSGDGLKTSLIPLEASRIQDVPVVLAGLTQRQKRAMRVCVDYMLQNDQLPTNEALAALMGLKSPNAAYHYFKAFQKVGFFEPNNGGRLRFTRVEGVSVLEVLKNRQLFINLPGLHGVDSWHFELKAATPLCDSQVKEASLSMS